MTVSKKREAATLLPTRARLRTRTCLRCYRLVDVRELPEEEQDRVAEAVLTLLRELQDVWQVV